MKNLQIRELIWNDVYTAAKILKPLKVDASDIKPDDLNIVAGITIFKNMIANVGDARVEVDEFLGSLFGLTGDEFNKLPLFKAVNCMKQFKQVDGFDDFFSSVKDIMK